MNDQNVAYKADMENHVEDDPLAELARIVSGEASNGVNSGETAPKMQADTVSQPVEVAATVAREEPVEMDLEAELMMELGGEADVAPAPAEQAATAESPSVEPTVEPVEELSFEDQLHAELSQELAAEPEAAVEAVEANSSEQLSDLDQQLQQDLAEVEQVTQEVTQDFSDASTQAAAEEPSFEAAIEEAVAQTEEFVPEAPIEMPVEVSAEVPAETPVAEPEIAAVEQIATDMQAQLETDEVDFGRAFEQEVQQMQEAQPEQEMQPASLEPTTIPQTDGLADAPIAQVASNAVSEAAPDQLEDGFADAFANELNLDSTQLDPNTPENVEAIAASSIQPVQHQASDFSADINASDIGPSHDVAPEAIQEIAGDASGGGRGFKMALGALGLALVAGLGVVGWGAMNSGSSDDAVIIKADDTPVKVKPADPGGKVIANTENKVYERVAGTGSNETQQDALINSTQEPVDIEKSATRLQPGENTTSSTGLGGVSPKRVQTLTIKQDGTIVRNEGPKPVEIAKIETATTTPVIETVTPAVTSTSGEPPIIIPEAIPQSNQPVMTQIPVVQPEAIQNAVTPQSPNVVNGIEVLQPVSQIPENAIVVNETSIPTAVTRSTTPQVVNSTPTRSVVRPAPQPVVRSTPAVDPNAPTRIAALPSSNAAPVRSVSGWAVQISSQRSAEAAQRSYVNLRNRFSSVLSSREVAVQRAVLQGKGTFYRVKIPASSRSDANSLCTRLKRAGGSCFVTQ